MLHRPDVHPEFPVLQRDVGEEVHPVAQDEKHLPPFTVLERVMEVADHHGIVAFTEAWLGDVADQGHGVERRVPREWRDQREAQ